MAAVTLHASTSIFPWPLFAIDPLSVCILIDVVIDYRRRSIIYDVVHLLIKCTEIYISAELSEIAHG